jgi:cell filamentation protein
MRIEEKLSKKRALEAFESGFLDGLSAGTVESLMLIHKKLFSDVYDFAGKTRDVNVSAGNFRFASAASLEISLKSVETLPQSTFEEIIQKYVEMNVVHPFREGNGRSMRIWLDLILKKELSKVVDWSKVDKNDYLLAMERSPIKDLELKYLLGAALTDEISSKNAFMKGIDASYNYEGYFDYKTENL